MDSSDKKVGRVKVIENGPYLVSGDISLVRETAVSDNEGTPVKWEQTGRYPDQENYSLCRCGNSQSKPYCDGTHVATDFDGTETARNVPYLEQARRLEGPDLILTDAIGLCSSARFCHRGAGTWKLTLKSGDPELRAMAIEEAHDCPSGRLMVWDRESRKLIRPGFEPAISLTQHPELGVSGPIRLKGGIPIESEDGTEYEVRDQVALCRCGHSGNKPFCDGSHIPARFKDEVEGSNPQTN